MTQRQSESDAVQGPHSAAAPHALRPSNWFEDVTDRTGIDFSYRNGREAGRYYVIESFGGGVAMLDYDGDGDRDLFFTGGGTISSTDPVAIGGLPSALFQNDGNWSFANVTTTAGFAEPPDYSQGCAVADFDGDGFPDLFVCCYGRSRLYRNQGDGNYAAEVFEEPPTHEWATAAAFGDFDRDGFLDLFVARYTDWSPEKDVACYSPHRVRDLCGPTAYPGTTCRLLHNSGDGRFDDWSASAGLKDNARGLGVVAADLNADGWVDFYVASDETPKQLYLGGPALSWQDHAAAAGVAFNEWGRPEGSMGIEVGDYNGDGLPDLFVTNFENEDHALYRNLGNGIFIHGTAASGLSGFSRSRVGFGTALADFDSDGWLDLFVLNGNPIYQIAQTPFRQQPQLFRNLGKGRFEDASPRGGSFFRELHSGRGSAVGDLDGDGALDLVAVTMNDRVRILRNRVAAANFFRVELRARRGEPEAVGAVVAADYAGRRLARFVARGTGYFSQSDTGFVFPLAAEAESAAVTVTWPGRETEVFAGLAARKSHRLVEGQADSARSRSQTDMPGRQHR